MILDVFEAELDKGAELETVSMGDSVTFSSVHLLESLYNLIWKDAFKEEKLSCLIVDFRSLPENPRQLNFTEVLSGSNFSIFFGCQTSMFSSQGHVSSITMQIVCVFEKTNISGLSLDEWTQG